MFLISHLSNSLSKKPDEMKLPLFLVLCRFATDRKVWERVLAGLYCQHIEHTKTEQIIIKTSYKPLI